MKTYTITFKHADGTTSQSETVGENAQDAVAWLKTDSSVEIENVKETGSVDNTRYCHYCGMKAKGWGFFDESVCEECS